MSRFLNEIITGTSNQSYEISRVLALAGVAAYIIYAGFHLFVNHAFNALEFGGGFGAILLGAGFGTAAKDKANPENAPPPTSVTVEAPVAGNLNINQAEA